MYTCGKILQTIRATYAKDLGTIRAYVYKMSRDDSSIRVQKV